MGEEHLWIIISDPALHGGKCVLVNLTESSHARFSFALKPGQHRYIYKDSDVNFGDAFLTTEQFIEKNKRLGRAKPHDDMNTEIVKEIIRIALSHCAFPPHLRKFLPPV
ncbi:MAG: hypothetical protein ABSE16_01070 [Verrucomicrobiota bacterium]